MEYEENEAAKKERLSQEALMRAEESIRYIQTGRFVSGYGTALLDYEAYVRGVADELCGAQKTRDPETAEILSKKYQYLMSLSLDEIRAEGGWHGKSARVQGVASRGR